MQSDVTNPQRGRRLLGDTLLFGISSFGSRILLLLLTPLYTSLLTKAEYGTADLLQITITFLYPLLTLATADAAMRFAMDKAVRREAVLGNALLFVLLASLVTACTYPLIRAWSEELAAYFGYFLLLFTLFNLHNALSSFIKGCGQTVLFAVQGVLHTVAIIASNLILLLGFRMRLDGYLYSLAIGYALPIVVIFFGGRLWRYLALPRIDRPLLRAMLQYSLPLIPALLAWEINSHIDRYMIIGFLGVAENGLYGVAHKIPTMLSAILTIFIQAWQLSAIENHGQADEADYHTRVYQSLETVSLLGCMLLILLNKPIARLLFAGEFFEAWHYVPMLVVSAMFSALSGFLAAAFRAEKKTTGLLLSVIAGAAVNILLNFALLPTIGLQGAAIATAVSFLFVWLIRLFSVQRLVPIRLSVWRTVLTYLFFLAGVSILVFDLPYALPLYGACCLMALLLRLPELIALLRSLPQLLSLLRRHA